MLAILYMIRIASKHLLDVCFADESHPAADSWCRKFALVYQLVNVLTGASHEDCSLGECKILLTGDVYNRLDSLQKVLLSLLALSLCRLGTMFWAIPLRTAVTCELLSTEGAFSCLSHLTPFLCGFTINFMQTTTEWTFVNHWQSLSTHSTMSRSSNEVTSLLFSLSSFCQPLYTLVNLCQPCPRDGKIKALKILRGRNALQR